MADLQTLPRTGIAFSSYDPKMRDRCDSLLANLAGGILRAITHTDGDTISLPEGQSHFGFLSRGTMLACSDLSKPMEIQSGFYFSIPGRAELLLSGYCTGVIVSAREYQSYLMTGLLERQGRLRYIDGCTDSLLIPPIKLGDPCLNLLYFPPHTDQTMHTHPSDRIGMILSGEGVCVTDDEKGTVETPLVPGMLFCIHTGGHHKFRTDDSEMRVLAYHPDSDYGPTDEVHPMMNRTMIKGVSASKWRELHTTAAE